MPPPVTTPPPPPFRLVEAGHLRIPLGGDRAINLFGRTDVTVTARAGMTAGGTASGAYYATRVEVAPTTAIVGDPWFALMISPVIGFHGVESMTPGDTTGGARGTFGGEVSFAFNTHGGRQWVVPRVGFGVSLGGPTPVPYVNPTLDISLAVGSDSSLVLSAGYRFDPEAGHQGSLSLGFTFGRSFSQAYNGTLFEPGDAGTTPANDPAETHR